jgi:FdhD protein
MARVRADVLTTEEPLEIRLSAGDEVRTIAVTMRTPGNDFELAAGFLFGEGIVTAREAIARIVYCLDDRLDDDQRYNVVTVELRSPSLPNLAGFDRHFLTTSACGVCGRATIDGLRARGAPAIVSGDVVPASVLVGLPEALRTGQPQFAATGGLHAAALFDLDGRLIAAREDIGRHNAVDKLVGWALLDGRLLLDGAILLVSGRAGYEIAQKAAAAGVPILCAVSAPSSLAVDLAAEFGMTLVGFLRGDRFNVYTGFERIALEPSS